MRVARFSEAPVVPRARLREHLAPTQLIKSPAHRWQLVLCLFSLLVLSFSTVGAHAQNPIQPRDYTSIVVFGDSLSDTGNVANLTEAKYGVRIPGPAGDYTDGRFTDGADTLPPAQSYFGVWVEQLAASLPSKPEIKDSLDGGTNYAYGYATTGTGTTALTFGPSNAFSVNIHNIGLQITDYLAGHPNINDKTLFIVWGGAIDLLDATSSDDVIRAGINQTLNIQRLIKAGATQFIVPNLPPLGLVPRLNGSPATSVPATKATVLYNDVLLGGLAVLRELNGNKRLQLSSLDVFTLFNQIIASPSKYSLANVTTSSQAILVDPDTYLFWDDLHPTTRGHNILAAAAAQIISSSGCPANSVQDQKGQADFHADSCGHEDSVSAWARH